MRYLPPPARLVLLGRPFQQHACGHSSKSWTRSSGRKHLRCPIEAETITISTAISSDPRTNLATKPSTLVEGVPPAPTPSLLSIQSPHLSAHLRQGTAVESVSIFKFTGVVTLVETSYLSPNLFSRVAIFALIKAHLEGMVPRDDTILVMDSDSEKLIRFTPNQFWVMQ